MTYDIKSAKEMILIRLSNANYALGVANTKEEDINTSFDEELISLAGDMLLEDYSDESREDYLNLIAVSHMLQGIANNLR